MLTRLSEMFGGLPTAAVIALLVLAAVQIPLQLYSLFDLAKRSQVAGGRKWVWAILIVVGNLIGAIAYLTIGRSTFAAIVDRGGAGTAEARKRAIDRLYHKPDR